MKKRKKSIVYKVSGDTYNIGNINNPEENSNNIDSLDAIKKSFFTLLNSLGAEDLKNFLSDRVYIKDPDINNALYRLKEKLKSIGAVKFVSCELIEYIEKNNIILPEKNLQKTEQTEQREQTPQNFENSGEQMDYVAPDFGNYPNTFEVTYEDKIDEGGLEKFVRDGQKKVTVMLNDILTRLKRLEENAERQHEINKDLKNYIQSVNKICNNNAVSINNLGGSLYKYVDDKIKSIPTQDNSIQTFIVSNTDDVILSETKGVFPKEWKAILELATARKNIYLEGATGCGKSFLSERLAEVLNLDYYSVSCTEGMSESEFKGWLLPLGDNGKFTYLASGFISAYEQGGVFCADEFDACDPNVALWVNKAIAGKSFYLPLRAGNHIIKKHKDFIWVACGNTLGSGGGTLHSGRNLLDGSTMDRHLIGIVKMEYDEKVEKKIADMDIYIWGVCMRKAMGQLNIDNKPLSTRFLEDATYMKRMYPTTWDIERIQKQFFKTWEDANIKRAKHVLNSIIELELDKAQK